jgi:hypothetical protein
MVKVFQLIVLKLQNISNLPLIKTMLMVNTIMAFVLRMVEVFRLTLSELHNITKLPPIRVCHLQKRSMVSSSSSV